MNCVRTERFETTTYKCFILGQTSLFVCWWCTYSNGTISKTSSHFSSIWLAKGKSPDLRWNTKYELTILQFRSVLKIKNDKNQMGNVGFFIVVSFCKNLCHISDTNDIHSHYLFNCYVLIGRNLHHGNGKATNKPTLCWITHWRNGENAYTYIVWMHAHTGAQAVTYTRTVPLIHARQTHTYKLVEQHQPHFRIENGWLIGWIHSHASSFVGSLASLVLLTFPFLLSICMYIYT